jgi:hypothetical protein
MGETGRNRQKSEGFGVLQPSPPGDAKRNWGFWAERRLDLNIFPKIYPISGLLSGNAEQQLSSLRPVGLFLLPRGRVAGSGARPDIRAAWRPPCRPISRRVCTAKAMPARDHPLMDWGAPPRMPPASSLMLTSGRRLDLSYARLTRKN